MKALNAEIAAGVLAMLKGLPILLLAAVLRLQLDRRDHDDDRQWQHERPGAAAQPRGPAGALRAPFREGHPLTPAPGTSTPRQGPPAEAARGTASEPPAPPRTRPRPRTR